MLRGSQNPAPVALDQTETQRTRHHPHESWAAGLPHPILLGKVRAAWMACATAFGDKAEITLQARKAYEEEFARRQQDEPTMLQIQRV